MLRIWGTLVLFLLATPMLVLAQNTGKLAGRVIDASTGEPLPGANVLLEGTQLGTITDVDGNYFILGIPVGDYDVQASFVGFQTQTVEDVSISSGYTRELNFELAPGVELDEVVVEYERPLIQKDAIGAPKVVTAEEIENLPVRGVAAVAALQGGVISNEGSNDLFIRGGREQEVSYYIDGVKVVGQIGIPTQAIQEQEVLIGAIPARYGDAMSGIISIATKTGAPNFFGTVEGISSEVLDAYGYNQFAATVGGPIVGNKVNFFLSGQYANMDDASPYAIETLRLNDDAFGALLDAPQYIQIVNSTTGALDYVPLPGDLPDSTAVGDLADFLTIPEGFEIARDEPLLAPLVFTGEDGLFSTQQSKPNPLSTLDLTGNVTFNPIQSISIRLGGGFAYNDEQQYDFYRSLYNRNRFENFERRTGRFFANLRQYLSGNTFYQIQAEYTDDRYWEYANGFSRDVEDLMFYGDIDHPVNEAARHYKVLENGVYVQQFEDGQVTPGVLSGTFALPGEGVVNYDKFRQNQFRVFANATTQIGLHQIEFGGEYEQLTQRRFYNPFLAGFANVARYIADENGAEIGAGVDSYAEVPYAAFESTAYWWGYDFRGLNEVNDQDLEAFMGLPQDLDGDGAVDTTIYNRNIAPYQPIYYAGYISDKIEYRDLVISIGLRADVFDNNTLVLRDPLLTVPVYRAGDLDELLDNAQVPGNIGSDYVVYFQGGKIDEGVVGYRTGDRYYDASGATISAGDITNAKGTPVQVEGTGQLDPSIFTDYEPELILMPRIGVSFPVTDQALFFASYNVTSQRPSERFFHPFSVYKDITGQARINNNNLKPEKTVQYELGFRQTLGSRAALQISGFLRNQSNKIAIRNMKAFPSGYGTYVNEDFTTTKGLEFEFDLRRTNNIALRANYTLSFAQGTGSDSRSLVVVQWRSTLGEYYPNFISPAAFDRRHSINLMLDYRLEENEGPELFGARPLSNFGINLVANIGSGMPYTALVGPSLISSSFTENALGDINEARMPWSSLVNLRVDRRFDLGGGNAFTAFVWVQNLLNTDNVYGVYRYTGLPDEDGYLASEKGLSSIRSATQNLGDPRAGDAYAFHYRNYINTPVAYPSGLVDYAFSGSERYSLPRRVRLGVRLSF